MIFLDTHAAVWLAMGPERLSELARAAIEEDEVALSPIAMLEMQYLHEIGRLKLGAEAVVSKLVSEIGLIVATDTFADVVSAALRESWTRDPFDRIIVGHARSVDAQLITKDEQIHQNYSKALW